MTACINYSARAASLWRVLQGLLGLQSLEAPPPVRPPQQTDLGTTDHHNTNM